MFQQMFGTEFDSDFGNLQYRGFLPAMIGSTQAINRQLIPITRENISN